MSHASAPGGTISCQPFLPTLRLHHGDDGRDACARKEMGDVVGVAREHLITVADKVHERGVDHVGRGRFGEENSDPATRRRRNVHLVHPLQQAGETGLPSAVTPDLGDNDSRCADGIFLSERTIEECPDDAVTTFVGNQRAGVEDETHDALRLGIRAFAPVTVDAERAVAMRRSASPG